MVAYGYGPSSFMGTMRVVNVRSQTVDDALAITERQQRNFDIARFHMEALNDRSEDALSRLAEYSLLPSMASFWSSDGYPAADSISMAAWAGFKWLELDAAMKIEELERLVDIARSRSTKILLSKYIEAPVEEDTFRGVEELVLSLQPEMVHLFVRSGNFKQMLEGMSQSLMQARKESPIAIMPVGRRCWGLNSLAPYFRHGMAFMELGYVPPSRDQGSFEEPRSTGEGTNHSFPPSFDIFRSWKEWDMRVALNGATAPRTVGPATDIYLRSGTPLLNDLTTALVNRAFSYRGLDMVLLPLEANQDELREMIDWGRKNRLRGLSITHPLDDAIIPMLNDMDRTVQISQSADTVRFDGTKSVGYNSMITALKRVLEGHLHSNENMKGLVIGSGGEARSAATALLDVGVNPALCSEKITESRMDVHRIDMEKGEVQAIPWNNRKSYLEDCSVLIHVPSPDDIDISLQSPVQPSDLDENLIVVETVISDDRTSLEDCARKAGSQLVPGTDVMVERASVAYGFWTARDPPKDVIRDKAREIMVSVGT